MMRLWGDRCVANLLLLMVIHLVFGAEAYSDIMNVTLTAHSYEIVDQPDSTVRIEMDGFSHISFPGYPRLPERTYSIVVPPDANVRSVTVRGENETELFRSFQIEAVPTPGDKAEGERNFADIFGGDGWYPPTAGYFDSSGTWRGYRYVRVVYYPFSVRPQSGRLVFRPTANVKIEFDRGAPETFSYESPRALAARAEEAARKFVNYPYMHRRYVVMPPGDVNYDSTVTSADVIYLVQHIFGHGERELSLALSGDIDCNGAIALADVIRLAAYIFKAGPAPREVCLRE